MTARRFSSRRVGFELARELLLAEVARRCRECGEPARLGLTRAEAHVYQGFECERCESWNKDELAEPDIPEWWEEVRRDPPDSANGRGGGAGLGGEDS